VQELLYVVKVGSAKEVQQGVKSRLQSQKQPSHVRLSTLAPLSNYGMPAGTEGTLLAIGGDGLVIGVEGNADAPTMFIPWQNVSYLADGSALAAELKTEAEGKKK
jgi:hypothetical protein